MVIMKMLKFCVCALILSMAASSGWTSDRILYLAPNEIVDGLVIKKIKEKTVVYPSYSGAYCDAVAIEFTPHTAEKMSPGSFFSTDEKGKKFLVTRMSQEKKCHENSNIEAALNKYKIEYFNEYGIIRATNPESIEKDVLTLLLSDINSDAGPVEYVMSAEGYFEENTTPQYYQTAPVVSYKSREVGFDLFVPTNFGLRGYFISSAGEIVSEGGAYNTAFYSVVVGKETGHLLISAPGVKKVFKYEKNTGVLTTLIDGYSVTNMRFIDNRLFFFGYIDAADWDKSAMYEFDLNTSEVKKLTDGVFADVRGMAEKDGRIYISNGSNNNVVVLDKENFARLYYWDGFSYPNGLSISSSGTLLVADEHAGVIRELDVSTGEEIRSLGFGQLHSPGYVEEILHGPYKGNWMVADTDSDRLVIFDPASSRILEEISGLRGPLDFAIIYH